MWTNVALHKPFLSMEGCMHIQAFFIEIFFIHENASNALDYHRKIIIGNESQIIISIKAHTTLEIEAQRDGCGAFLARAWALLLLMEGCDISQPCVGGCVGEHDSQMRLCKSKCQTLLHSAVQDCLETETCSLVLTSQECLKVWRNSPTAETNWMDYMREISHYCECMEKPELFFNQ